MHRPTSRSLRVEALEDRYTPAAALLDPSSFAVGSAAGVTVYTAGGQPVRSLDPFPGAGDVRVAVGDVTGDGVPDLVAGTGPGQPAQVKVYDGATGAPLAAFQPFEGSFTGGVFVAVADLSGDGKPEVIVSPDQGGGPVVAVYDGAALARGQVSQLTRFFGIADPNFRGGARVAAGDVRGDGRPDLVVAAGVGGGPRVSVLDGTTVLSGAPRAVIPDFYAFEPGLRNGAYVTVADLNGDGAGDLVFGAGPGGGPRVLAVSGRTLTAAGPAAALAAPLADVLAGGGDERAGVSVSAVTVNGQPELVTADGQTGQTRLYQPGAAGLTLVAALGPAAPAATTVTPTVTAATPTAPAAPSLGDKIVAFAAANLGNVVSAPDATGCAALASAALAAAGAKPEEAFGSQGPVADHYAWGTPVYQRSLTGGYGSLGSLADLRPGDVLQFDNYAEQRADGSWSSASHHTAIVESVDPGTGRVTVLQQNSNGNPATNRGDYYPGSMTGGVVTAYRPVAA